MKSSTLKLELPTTRSTTTLTNRQQSFVEAALDQRQGIRLKSILVPIDFSTPSLAALDGAVRVARRFGSQITLVHVVASAEMTGKRFRLAYYRAATDQKDKLERLAREKGIARDLVERSVVLRGHPFNQITELAASLNTDLIVMATHGYGGIKHFMLGSTTERVVRYAPCPVLVARNHLRDTGALRLRNILVPVDFSECAQNALKYAGAFAREFSATETLLHVVYPIYYFTGADFDVVTYGKLLDEMQAGGEAELSKMFEEQQAAGLNVRKMIRRGHPASEIIQQAMESKPDLIVISTHGRTGFKHAWLGSVTENVLRLAPCDVLVVRRLEHEFV